MPDRIWKANKGKTDLETMRGQKVYIGIDLAVSRDISGYGKLFVPDDPKGVFRFVAKYYCPEEGAMERSRQDRVPYLDWADKGLLTLTPVNITDYDFIEQDLLEDNCLYYIN